MMRCAVSFGFLALVLAGPALANGKVDVAACKAMQATLAPRQAEISELTEQREASALRAEEAGIAWEDSNRSDTSRVVRPRALIKFASRD